MENLNKRAGFSPLYEKYKNAAGKAINIAVEDGQGFTGNFKFNDMGDHALNERMVKMLLWAKGGIRIITDDVSFANFLSTQYNPLGARAFDSNFMGDVYGEDFEVIFNECVPNNPLPTSEKGASYNGCRLGLDVGASEIKIVALNDGNVVYSGRDTWLPKSATGAQYHYDCILKACNTAAKFLPRVDAIGISSAGIILDNQIKVSSLYMGLPKPLPENARMIYYDLAKQFNSCPIKCANDGDVTAFAGGSALGSKNMIGLSMGTSLAGGALIGGALNGWLNELAFVPLEVGDNCGEDDWSGDFGCGVNYLSQYGVIRMAEIGGFKFDAAMPAGERMRYFVKNSDEEFRKNVFSAIGEQLAYGLLLWQKLYGFSDALIMGGVMAAGENYIRKTAEAVLSENNSKITILKSEKNNLGQGEAAAAMPNILSLDK